VVTLSGCPVPQVKGIDPLKFFQTLDYNQPWVAAEIPAYENELWKAVDKVRPILLDPKQNHSPESAMALVYAAFYMADANYGAMYGAITYEQLTRFRKFAPDRTDLASELAAREQAAHDLLSLARQTLPDEPMIKGYLATSHLRKDFDLSGQLSQDDVEQVVIAAENDPPFNLYSALIVLDDFTPRADLQDRVYRVLDEMTSGDGPCDAVIPPRGCFPNLKIVPFAFQGSRVIAGDGYLKRALTLLAANVKDPEGRSYVQRALGLYQKLFDKLLFFGGVYKLTQSWPLKDSVRERIDTAKAMLGGTLPPPQFLRAPKYKAVYQCASCHSSTERAGLLERSDKGEPK
jgi:hypothetical protein